MGKLLPQYQKSIIEDVVYSITSNVSNYYVFAANPIVHNANAPTITTDDYTTTFTNDWQMIFGKRVSNGDIVPVILNNAWTANTVYNRYDNTVANLHNHYVITPPSEVGGYYHIFTCIDNAGNSVSTSIPDRVQPTSFTKEDGYTWRYITSISKGQYNKTATNDYAPVTSNSTIVQAAHDYAGIEVVVINNGGVGYQCYSTGIVQSVPNTTVIQISADSSLDNDYYTGAAIYFQNLNTDTNQLLNVVGYNVNTSSGAKYVTLDKPANTDNITSGVTTYSLAPAVIFHSDGDLQPVARCIVDPTANSIGSIQMLEKGSGISWCNVSIQSNTSYGHGANVYAIVPPPGGHGYNPSAALGIKGFAVSYFFANSENGTILANTTYNKIGLIKNPYTISQDTGVKTTVPYIANTFSSVLNANVTTQFTLGDTVVGQTTGARGTVAFCNSTVLCLTGDKYFANNEKIISVVSTATNSQLVINNRGDIYTKDVYPLYVQNINDVARTDAAIESFKLIIKV